MSGFFPLISFLSYFLCLSFPVLFVSLTHIFFLPSSLLNYYTSCKKLTNGLCSLSLFTTTISVGTQLSGRNWFCSSPDEAEEKTKFYVTQVLVSGILRVTEGRRRRARRQPGVRPGKNSRPLCLRKHRVALQRNASPEVAARRGVRDVTSGRVGARRRRLRERKISRK